MPVSWHIFDQSAFQELEKRRKYWYISYFLLVFSPWVYLKSLCTPKESNYSRHILRFPKFNIAKFTHFFTNWGEVYLLIKKDIFWMFIPNTVFDYGHNIFFKNRQSCKVANYCVVKKLYSWRRYYYFDFHCASLSKFNYH